MTIRPNSVGKTHRFTLRSLIAASLSVILLGETAFAYKPETSLWADRKSKSPVMLASAALTPSALPKLLSDVAAAPLAPAKILSTDLPAAFVAQVQIKKALPGPRKNTVVVLEDVHQNVDAQRRLSSALLALAAEPGSAPVPVALEGAVGGFKVGAYHRFPDRGIAKAVADSFLASGDLAGPSHAGFIAFPSAGARGLALTGADDAAHYAANVAAYHAASKEKAAAQAAVADRRKDAAARAATVFSNDLRAFDAAVDAHHRGALPLGDFVRILIKNGASDSVLVRFDEAYRMERGLDLAAVERERRAVLEKLLPRLDEGETRDLVRLTLGYREGAVSFAGYYAALENVCRKNGVELSRTPAFAGYLRYVAAADGIDAAALFAAVSKAETAAYARLAAGEAARIVSEIRALRLAERITDFALTTSDWTAYQASRSALRGLDLTPFERFYEEADARDAAMVRAASRDANISVLVIGGFHSEAVAAALQKTGRPVIVCSPKLARVDAGTGSAYLSVFDREKTPLERLFAGEKLFLAAPPAGAVRPLIPAPDPSLEMAHDVVALTAHARGDEAAARRAAGELGVDAVLYSVVHGDGSTEMVETIGGENIRTVISANGTVERGAQSTRKIGGLTVATYTGSNPGALLSGLRTTVTNVVNRTVANRLFLMLPGFVLMAGSMYILFYLQPVALATAPRMISVFVAMSIGVVWVVAFGHQALGILAARNRPVTAYPMIEELRSLDILPSDRVGAVASVIEGNIHLNGYFFDVTRNRSRLTEEQQRSLLREERRHIRYQRSRGLTNVADRNFVARGFEEFWVNVVMPVLDGLGWTADLLGNLRREQNVDPALLSERADLRAYLQKLYAERESPGSQEFEQVIFVSDQHGTIDVFDDLILDAILQARPIREIRVIDASETWTVAKLDQTFADLAGVAVSGIAVPQGSVRDMLEQLGQSTAERLRGHVFFHNLRSLTDAGRFSPDVAARAQEYLDAGFEYRFNPDAGLDAQLQYFGVSLNELRGKIFFHNLGDLMDRGPYGIKIFRRSKELIDAQLSDFIVGNHDLWTMLNLMGVHLPFYRGYKLYDYTDHIDAEDPSQNVQRLLAHYHNTMPESLDKTWWAERMAEYREYHDKRQKEVWIPQVDAPVVAAWKKISAGTEAAKEGEANGFPTALSKAQLSIWDRLRGFNTNTDTAIWAGSRAVGTVSVGYWKRLLADMKAEVPAGTADPTEVQKLILEMTPIVERIIPELEADITQKVKVEGKWWWRMFEALNSQNYTSAEWWGMDWVFHEGWGPTVLKELNEILAREQGEGAVKVTNRNYFRNGEIDRVVSFFKKNFTLFNRDIQQNVYMHAFLPVDMDKSSPGFGEFYFTYKGVTYRGKGRDGFPSVWEGLRLIENDVRTGENVSELMEALELVNSWYADNTTLAKPGQVSDVIKDVGAERLSKANGFNRLFTGHIPFVEFAKQREKKGVPNSFMTDLRLFFEDHGMGSKFGSRGAYVITSPDKGVILRGRENEKSKAILSNVRTVMNEKEVKRKGDPLTTLFDNPGISAAEYLDILIGDVEGRLQEIDRTLSGGNLAARTAGNRYLFAVTFMGIMVASILWGNPAHSLFDAGLMMFGFLGAFNFLVQGTVMLIARLSAYMDWEPTELHWAVPRYGDLRSPYNTAGLVVGGRILLNRGLMEHLPLSQQRSVIREEIRHQRYQRAMGLTYGERGFFSVLIEEIAVNILMPAWEIIRPNAEIDELSREESPEHAVVRELTVSTAQLEELSAGFRQEIRAGMGNNPSSVEMLHTVARFPNGRETGLIATIDWGGSTARVSIWELEGNGVVRKVATMKDDYLFSDDEKKNPRGLYSMLTNKLEEVIRLLPGKDQDRPIDVVVSFAFPPTRWSKSWSDPNGLKPMSPKEIRESFNEEFARRGRNRLTAQRGENDTLGPIMRETYARRSVNPKAQPATVSVILGTGHNVAAFIDDSIWNFESAGFDGVKAIATSMDEETDRNQTNPGEHIFEKMVTGDYLGEILRTSLARLRRETKEFAWTSPSFTTPNMLESEFVSEIAATRGEKEAMSRLLAGKGVASPSDNEIATTYALAASILNRSAGLVAMEIAATIRIQDPGLFNKHIVVIEGGVYYKADRYPERLRKALEDILTKPYADKIEIVSNKGREGAGMAVLVAAATRGDRTPNALIVDQQNEDEIRVAASPSALDDPYRSVQTVIKGVDLQGFLASRLPAVKVQTKTASGGKEGAHQQWTFEDGSGEYSGDITVRLADGIWTITGQTSIQQLTEDIYEHILSVLSRERLSQEADGRLRSFGNRLGLAATFLAPAILSGLSLLVTGGDATGAGWITTFAITGLWALGSLPFLYQAFWIVFAPRPGAFWHGIHTIPGVQIAWGDLGRGVVAQAVGDQVLINSNLFGYLPPSQQRSALREEYRHMLYRARANRSGIRVSSPLSRAWEEWYVNVVMPVTDAIDALRGVHHIQVLFVDKPAVRIPVRRDDGGIRFRNRFGKGGPVDPSLNADGIAALGMILIGSGIPAGVAVTVGAISGWIARSNGLSRRASIAVGASIGAALLAPGLALAAAVAAAAIIAYRRMAPSLLARRWISEGRRYADAVRNAGQTSLLDALDAAAPRGVFFGRRTANDFRNAALSGFAQAANAETNETRRALQWATFAGYRRSVDAGNVVTSAVQAGERAFAGARISVAAYHFNQVGEAAVPSEIAEFRALIAQARRDREDGREVSLVAAVAGEIPAAYRAEFDALVNANRDIVGVVTVSDDLRTEDGLAYSYEKLLQKAMEGSDLDAVRALMSGSYENAAFVSFSKIPSQFLADGRLRAIWTVLANIGAGWAPVPVDTMIRAAELVKQQA